MSWTLISETDTGYKKWRDTHGNLRYQRADGTFTSAQGWAGTHAQGATEVARTETPESGTVTSTDVWGINRLNTDKYKEAINFVIREPLETGYSSLNALGRGYDINDYPVEDRADRLRRKTEQSQGYDLVNWAVTSLIVDTSDGTIISSGERHTSMHPPEDTGILEADFRQIIDDLRAQQADYGNVIITETKLKVRTYYE